MVMVIAMARVDPSLDGHHLWPKFPSVRCVQRHGGNKMINHRIFPELELIAICNWGKTSVKEIMKFVQVLHGDPDYSRSYDSMVDCSQMDIIFTRDEIDTLAGNQINTSLSVGRVAIIAPSDIQFGISRMHEIVSEVQESPLKMGVFRDNISALKWLNRAGLDIEKIFKEIRGTIP